MHFMGISITKQNIRVRVIEYLRNLYKLGPIIEEFEDGTFRIFATFVYSDVYKKSNCWFLRVYIIQDLYEHAYPFMFSQSFRNYKNLTDCFLKLKLIQAISVKGIKKTFYLSQFLQQIKLSNQKIVEVKKDLIVLIQDLVQEAIIQDKITLVYHNTHTQDLDQDQLNFKQVNRRIKYLVFYEKVHKK